MTHCGQKAASEHFLPGSFPDALDRVASPC